MELGVEPACHEAVTAHVYGCKCMSRRMLSLLAVATLSQHYVATLCRESYRTGLLVVNDTLKMIEVRE